MNDYLLIEVVLSLICSLQQYGTDFYTEATFGGRLFMLLKYDRSYQDLVVLRKTEIGTPLTKEQLVERTNPHFSSNVFEKFFEYQGGQFITDEPLGTWLRSISMKPVIIKGSPSQHFEINFRRLSNLKVVVAVHFT
jgi:hypothetical protein